MGEEWGNAVWNRKHVGKSVENHGKPWKMYGNVWKTSGKREGNGSTWPASKSSLRLSLLGCLEMLGPASPLHSEFKSSSRFRSAAFGKKITLRLRLPSGISEAVAPLEAILDTCFG